MAKKDKKLKVKKTIFTVEGTLYENEIVFLELTTIIAEKIAIIEKK